MSFFSCTRTSLSYDAFNGLKNITELRMYRCDLSYPPNITYICDTLEVLVLTKNRINYFPNSYFDECYSLKRLLINDNNLLEIPSLDFISKTLEYLMIYNNLLKSCIGLCNLKFPHLTEVNLDKNEISTIDWGAIVDNWPMISHISLRNTNLTTLPDLRRYQQSSHPYGKSSS